MSSQPGKWENIKCTSTNTSININFVKYIRTILTTRGVAEFVLDEGVLAVAVFLDVATTDVA